MLNVDESSTLPRSKSASTTFPLDGGVGVSLEAVTANISTDIREMADMVPHQIWFSAPQGGIIYINNRFYDYTGLDRDKSISANAVSIIHPDDITEYYRTRNEAIQREEPWRFDYRLRRHDGEYRWHVGRTLPLFDKYGVLRRWVGTATDIHEEVTAARRLREFMREVLSAVTQGKLQLCDNKGDLPKKPASKPDTHGQNAVLLTAETLGAFRQMITRVSEEAGLDPERTTDLLMASGEAALNTVVHGKGGEGYAYADSEKGCVQVWVSDCGDGIEERLLHRATLEAGFSSAGSLGQGFPLMLRTADRVFLLTGKTGTTVVLEIDRVAQNVAFI